MPFCMEVENKALERAGRIARTVELESIDVVRLSAERRDEGNERPAALLLQLHHGTRGVLSEDRTTIVVTVDFAFEAAEKDSETTVAEAELSVRLYYRIGQDEAEEPNDAAVEDFAQINGTYNAWPYWREYLHNTLGRLGLPGILAPVLQLLPVTKATDGECISAMESKPRDSSGR